MSPYDVNRPQWVNSLSASLKAMRHIWWVGENMSFFCRLNSNLSVYWSVTVWLLLDISLIRVYTLTAMSILWWHRIDDMTSQINGKCIVFFESSFMLASECISKLRITDTLRQSTAQRYISLTKAINTQSVSASWCRHGPATEELFSGCLLIYCPCIIERPRPGGNPADTTDYSVQVLFSSHLHWQRHYRKKLSAFVRRMHPSPLDLSHGGSIKHSSGVFCCYPANCWTNDLVLFGVRRHGI